MKSYSFFGDKRHVSSISIDANIVSACIRVFDDLSKIVTNFFLKNLCAFLPYIKTPLTVMNAFVQAVVVIFDKNCPNFVRQLTLLSVLGIASGAISIAIFFPSSVMASFLLAIYTHLVRLSYRLERCMRAIEKQEAIKQAPSLLARNLEEEQRLFLTWQKILNGKDNLSPHHHQQQKDSFEQAITDYIEKTKPKHLKLEIQKRIVNKAILSCFLMIFRGISTLLLIALSPSLSSLSIALTIFIFTINLIDLARTIDNKNADNKAQQYLKTEKKKLFASFNGLNS